MSNLVNSRARSVADTTEGRIVAAVEIAASPERVFAALTSDEIVQWWGDDGTYRTTSWVGDVRVGGTWRANGVSSEGVKFGVGGTYLEIDSPRKLVHSWESDWDKDKTVVTYRLEAIEGGTRLILRHDGFTSAESCDGHAAGWSQIFGWLKSFVEPKAGKRFFLIHLQPPRPTFMLDMNDAEKTTMMAHVGYWKKLMSDGVAVAFGPVGGERGGFGVAIVELENDSTIDAIREGDPAILSGHGFRYEVMPMLQAMVRPA